MFRVSVALAFALTAGAPAMAETLDIGLRPGVSLRLAVESPGARPAAVVLLFAGGHGKLGLDATGRPRFLRGNFLVRARHHFRTRGIAVVLVDAPTDHQGPEGLWAYRLHVMHAGDIGQAVDQMRRRFARPVWLLGTSAGTLSVAVSAAHLTHGNRPDGLIFTSSFTRPTRRRPFSVFQMHLGAYPGPVLAVAHREDTCMATPAADAPRLLAAFSAARPKKLLSVSGGAPPESDPCEARSAHGFLGIEAQVMNAIADFILAPSP